MKSIKWILALAIFALFAVGCTQPSGGYGTGTPVANGRAVFTISDAAANMSAVTSVKVTVDSVQVHSAAEGWVTVSSTPKTYDLLLLKASGTQALLADAQLKEGTYQQTRLHVSKVIVADKTGDHEAKLPSGDLKVAGIFKVGANSTTTVLFDFLANESLHVTGKGEYILAPVVHVEGREQAEAETHENTTVNIHGGHVTVNVTVGMDENGNTDVNLRIPVNVSITIDNGVVHVWRATQGSKGQGHASANASAGVYVG